MKGSELDSGDEVSFFAIGASLLRQRWRILRYMLAGGVIAVLPYLSQKLSYTAYTSFVPQVIESQPSGLSGIASQFGVSLPGAGSSQSPQFYVDLLSSPVILRPIVVDTITVVETGNTRAKFLDLMNVPGNSHNHRLDNGIQMLRQMMSVKVVRETGVLTLAVTSPWPSASVAIANAAVDRVNAFNLHTRRTQAVEERRFTEERLAEARMALRDAENRMQSFLQGNRQLDNSAELTFERDRLHRKLTLQQEIVESLAKSYEDIRIREVRNVPVITVIERASLPTQPNPRGRARRGLWGMLFGGLLASFLSLVAGKVKSKRSEGDPDVDDFFTVLSESKKQLTRPLRWRNAAK